MILLFLCATLEHRARRFTKVCTLEESFECVTGFVTQKLRHPPNYDAAANDDSCLCHYRPISLPIAKQMFESIAYGDASFASSLKSFFAMYTPRSTSP